MPWEEPARLGLTNTGHPSSVHVGKNLLLVVAPEAGGQADEVPHVDAGGAHVPLETDLVHGQSGGQDARPHIWDPRDLQQALHRPVLPERSVQYRERDIDGQEIGPGQKTLARPVQHQGYLLAAQHLRQLGPQPKSLEILVVESPGPLPVDADAHDLETPRVEHPQYASGGNTTDAVLRTGPPVDDAHPDP